MRNLPIYLGILLACLVAGACSAGSPRTGESARGTVEGASSATPVLPTPTPVRATPTSPPGPEAPTATLPAEDAPSTTLADVISVEVSGEPGAYRFAVGIRSPDKGCDRYADWWEVVSTEGELIYRRVLLHSHVEEQPFVRSGGPVEVGSDRAVWVRAHMSTGGYGGAAFKGSVEAGFSEATLEETFAADLEDEPPLPDGCAF